MSISTEDALRALKQFVQTVDATGGLIRYADGTLGCCADEDWLDLADATLEAQTVLTNAGWSVTLRIQDENGKREHLRIDECQ